MGRRRLAAAVIATVVFASATFTLYESSASAATFTNPTALTIADATCGATPGPGEASSYPSTITLSGLVGTVTDVNVTLTGMTHPFERDFEILLVGPTGQKLVLASDAGSGAVTAASLTLDDAAPALLPLSASWGSGAITAKPTDYDEPSAPDVYPAPAPVPDTATTLASYDGTNPNGVWSLYALDDQCVDVGSISGGWSLDVTTSPTAATTTVVDSSANPSFAGQAVTFTAGVTSAGINVTTGTVTFTNGATTLAAGVPVDGSGEASFTTSALTAGSHTITATYDGMAPFDPSAATVVQQVDSGTAPIATTFCNSTPITILDHSAAAQYPSNILVSGSGSSITKVTAQLKNVTHTFPSDIDVLLVGPTGTQLILLSDAGDGTDASNVSPVFDDGALGPIGATGAWALPNVTFTARPTNYATGSDSFPAPAPILAAGSTLATYDGTDPNGTWSLYVVDDTGTDVGSIAGGWCLSVSTPAQPTMSTNASAGISLGNQVSDTATLAGGTNPTGTVTFRLFGAGDTTCSAPPAFTSTVSVAGNGSYPSGAFTPATPGTYRWTASYSGDANNDPAAGACNDPNESAVVTPGSTTLVTQASAGTAVGGSVSDTATLAGGVAPSGTITFGLFGVSDPTCAGSPVFTSTVPVSGNGDYPSGSFAPTAPGTYRWVASYSGDAGNAAAATTCDAASAAVIVAPATTTTITPTTTTTTSTTTTSTPTTTSTSTAEGVANAGDSSLPTTGSPISTMVAIALALVAAGALIVALGRRAARRTS